MNYITALEYAKKLQKICGIGELVNENIPFVSQGLGDDTVYFIGKENIKLFNEAVDFFWKNDDEIFNNFTRKSMEKFLYSLLREFKDSEITIEKIKEFYKGLLNKEILTREIVYPIYGVKYKAEEPLMLGPFRIYNQKNLVEKYPMHKTIIETRLYNHFDSDVVIAVTESAKESKRLYEKAKIKLQQFEETMRFLIGYNKNMDIGIFNFKNYKVTRAFSISNSSTGFNSAAEGTFIKIDLELYKSTPSANRLWGIFEKTKKNDLEKRLITAISWIGKGLRDEEPARAFVQYIFALESLLQVQQKNEMISPSITYTLAEFATFILAKNYDERKEINKKIKNLYNKRSQIAHGSSIDVDKNDLTDALSTVSLLVNSILSEEPFSEFDSINQIRSWVEEQKYSN